jgi:putative ABC transport system permease protein
MLKALFKYKISSGLTLLSLIISFLGIIILTLYVSFEKSFDTFHTNAQHIYRLETVVYGGAVPATLRDIIPEQIPEVEKLVTVMDRDGKLSSPELLESNMSFQASLLYADKDFFNIFTYPLILGDKETALAEPNTIVLTQSMAKKIFNEANPLNALVFIDGKAFKVSGVMQDFPKNSSFNYDAIPSFLTFSKIENSGIDQWSEWSYNIFMLLKPGANINNVALKVEEIPALAEQITEMKSRYPNQAFITLQKLTNMHFVPQSGYAYANPKILNILMLLALILAVMGAVNFINFSTSQAPLRAKSLSILQVLGARRLASMGQIIAESVFLSVIALGISVLIYWYSYTGLESLFGISGLHLEGRSIYLVWFFLFAISYGIIAGIYPARYITSSPITQSVKGKPFFSGKGKTFRNTLFTIQFIFTIVLIAAGFIIEKQLNFWRNYDIGINKEQVVYFKTTEAMREHAQAMAEELINKDNITDYTYSNFIPSAVNMGWGRMVDGQHIQLKSWPVDDRFLEFYGIKIIKGRPFKKNSQADVNTFILNKKAVEEFGWTDNPLEKKFNGFDFMGQIIGVTDNFNFSSLKEDIQPMVLWYTDSRKMYLMLRLKPENYTQTLAYIKNTVQKFDPKNPVEIKFLDDTLNKLYEKEEKMARLIEFVAMWCMLLAITGLLGLIIFISRDRIKEIGIRKVNGATVLEVIKLLNKDILKLVAIAFVIATPIAWYAMQKWLQEFTYKTQLSWWVFALAGLIAFVIALLAVSWQSFKAARRNPVESLRYE